MQVPLLTIGFFDLAQGGTRRADAASSGVSFASGLSSLAHRETSRSDDIESRRQQGGRNIGLAWVARGELLRKHGLYDAFILGGGDRVTAFAALGRFDEMRSLYHLNEARFDHYVRWARPFFADTQSHVGYIAGSVLHLWHGSIESRKYFQRVVDFAQFDFDPMKDIVMSDSGVWQWSSDKPEMHQYFEDYFVSRGM